MEKVVLKNNYNSQLNKIPSLFFLGFSILLIREIINQTVISIPAAIDNLFFVSGIIYLALYILLNVSKLNVSTNIFLLIWCVIAIISYINAGYSVTFTTVLMIWSILCLDDYKIAINLWFQENIILVSMTVIAYLLARIIDPDIIHYFVRDNGFGLVQSVRDSFFFSHPNIAALRFLMIALGYYCINQGKVRFSSSLLIITLGLFLLVLTDSKTSGISFALVPILYYLQNNTCIFNNNIIKKTVMLMPILLTIIVYLLAGPFYSSNIGSMFTNRIMLWHYCLLNQGISLFGQPFQISTSVIDGYVNYYTTLDCFYAHSILVIGISYTIFLYVAFMLSAKRIINNNLDIVPLIILYIVAFTESGSFGLSYFPVIFLVFAFSNSRKWIK